MLDRVIVRRPKRGNSAQRIADYKSFLRLHLDTDSAATVFQIGLKHLSRRGRMRFDGPGTHSPGTRQADRHPPHATNDHAEPAAAPASTVMLAPL
jgi:hypothetical protein